MQHSPSDTNYGHDQAALCHLQICKAGVARMRKIWFSRHGESEYNMFAKIGGDSNISPQGQNYAKLLPDLLVDRVPLVSRLLLLLWSAFCRSRLLMQARLTEWSHHALLILRKILKSALHFAFHEAYLTVTSLCTSVDSYTRPAGVASFIITHALHVLAAAHHIAVQTT